MSIHAMGMHHGIGMLQIAFVVCHTSYSLVLLIYLQTLACEGNNRARVIDIQAALTSNHS